MTTLDFIGYLGSLSFALCGLPQAAKSLRDKHSEGLSWGFLGMWTFGEICVLVYAIGNMLTPLILNYAANLMILSVILYYKIEPKATEI